MRSKIYINDINELGKYNLSKATYYRALKRRYFYKNYHKKEMEYSNEYPEWLKTEEIIIFAEKLANKYGWRADGIDIQDYVGEILLRWCELAGKMEMDSVKYRVVVAKNACRTYYHKWFCGGSGNGNDVYYISLQEFVESSLNKHLWLKLFTLSEKEKKRIEKFLNGKASLPLRIKRKIQKMIGG